jgi:hypothetical protein
MPLYAMSISRFLHQRSPWKIGAMQSTLYKQHFAGGGFPAGLESIID